MAVPMRDLLVQANPKVIYEFGDKLHEKLTKDNEAKQAERERSGKISGGKLGKPTLWIVLDMIGIPDEFDPYVLGKFQRGNDVEDRAIQFLTGVDPHDVKPGEVVDIPNGQLLAGKLILQKEGGYKGGTGYIDITQVLPNEEIYHEIKSSTKLAYDKVSASGASKSTKEYKWDSNLKKKVVVSETPNQPRPYLHHELQLAYYCLGDNVQRGFLHYLNADDYRLITFAINPEDYREEIDKEIEDVKLAFTEKKLPAFVGLQEFHKLKNYQQYKEWNDLSPDEMMNKLRNQFPEAYKKFLEMEV